MAADLMDDRKLTSSEQVHVLQNLSQQASAFLIGLTARSLRDHPEIPRHADGSYDAREVVKWSRRRVELDEIDDSTLERIMTALDWIYQDTKAPFVQLVDDLAQDFGDMGYAYLGRALADDWRESYKLERDDKHCRPPTDDELQGLDNFDREQLIERRAKNGLRIKTVCENCGRVRHGKNWPSKYVPEGYATVSGICPKCSKRR